MKPRDLVIAAVGMIAAAPLGHAQSNATGKKQITAADVDTTCSRPELQHQNRDVATVRRLEREWSLAYLRGDEALERCLLLPNFTEVLKDGSIKYLQDELGFARKNKGRNLPIPHLPASIVLLHGNVAAAYGVSESTARDGTQHSMRYVDYYVWESGVWHAYFAQQTPIVIAKAATRSGPS